MTAGGRDPVNPHPDGGAGLTLADLQPAGCFAPPPIQRAVCYRNAEGLTWDGQGERPAWLQRAVNAGQNAEFSRVEQAS